MLTLATILANVELAKAQAAKGFYAIAIDLFNGSVATNRDEANADSLQKLNAPLLDHFGTFSTGAPAIGFVFFNFDWHW